MNRFLNGVEHHPWIVALEVFLVIVAVAILIAAVTKFLEEFTFDDGD